VTDLNGSTDRIALAPEVYVLAPGLVGTVELLETALLGTRADEPQRATPALTTALANQEFATVHSLEIAATPVVGPGVAANRGADNRPLLTLEVPDRGPQQPQVVLLADEQGVVTWHFPQPTVRPNTVRFDIPADTVATAPPGPGQTRGLVSLIGKKLLSVLVFRALEAGAKVLAQVLAQNWENQHRPPRLRRFTGPDDCATVTPLDGHAWDMLTGGRALLFIHGTCSTSQGGFGALDAEVWGQLSHRYDDRVFAYDHPTLSVDPLTNVNTLAMLVPPGVQLDVDIVAHSRGGLVARALACAPTDASFPLRVSKVVHVGVPNAGTALANVERYGKFIDRTSTLLNLAPDGPLSVVADILDGILTVVKIIGCNGIGALPGLSAMDPANKWLPNLAARPAPPHTSYAIGSDYAPSGGVIQLVRVPDGLADLVFALQANDMVVPAGGVYDAGTAVGFPIPEPQRVAFSKKESVWHCAYFGQPKTQQALLDWLTGTDAAAPSPA
jgi:hypothetical protein